MDQHQRQAEFVRLIAEAQRRLYAYILTLVPRPDVADDILQETNMVLWEKCDQFELGTDFSAWAATIAHFQTLAYLKRHNRQRWLRFDDELIGKLAPVAAERVDAFDDRRRALHHCLSKLPEADRQLIRCRYNEDTPVKHVAEQVGRSAGAIKQALYRIRGTLLQCIEKTLAAEGPEPRRPGGDS